MTKRFKESSEMMSPSLLPSECSTLTSSGYPRDSFDRFGIDLSANIFQWLQPNYQLIFRGLNKLSSHHMFDQTQTLIIDRIISKPEYSHQTLEDSSYLETLANTYRPYVSKLVISLDHYTITEIGLFLNHLIRDRRPLDTLRLTSNVVRFIQEKIEYLLELIPVKIAERIFFDFPMDVRQASIYELMFSRFGGSFVGLFLNFPRFDLLNQHRDRSNIEILKVNTRRSVRAVYQGIATSFTKIFRLYIYDSRRNDFDEVIKSTLRLPNLNFFAFHSFEERYNEINLQSRKVLRSLASRKPLEFLILSEHSEHFVYSSIFKSLWCVTDTYIGKPELPYFAFNV